MGTLIASAIRFRWNSCLRACRLSALQFSLGHQSVRITEKHYAPWVRARQEQLEADFRRTWQTHEPQQGVHGGYTENDACNPFQIKAKEWWRRGESNPRPKSATTRSLHAYLNWCATPRFSPPGDLRADRAFARGAWNEQEAQPTSPMVLARALRTERLRPAHCVTLLAGPMSEARGSVRLIN